MAKTIYEIDGSEFATLEEFYDVISRALIPDAKWGRNLDAFNDTLRGGFGTPEGGFILHWKNAEISRARLGYSETTRQLEKRLTRCHPLNRSIVANDLAESRRLSSSTVFDWLIEIIQTHCPGDEEAEGGVELRLD